MEPTKTSISRNEFFTAGHLPVHSFFISGIGHIHYRESTLRSPYERGEILVSQERSDTSVSQTTLTLETDGTATIYRQLWQRKAPTVIRQQYGPWIGEDYKYEGCRPARQLPVAGWMINPDRQLPLFPIRPKEAVDRTYLENPAYPFIRSFRDPLLKALDGVQFDSQIMPPGSFIEDRLTVENHYKPVLSIPRKAQHLDLKDRATVGAVWGLMHELKLGECRVGTLQERGSILLYRGQSGTFAAEASVDFNENGTATIYLHHYSAYENPVDGPKWFGQSLVFADVVPNRIPGSPQAPYWQLYSGMPYYRLPPLLDGGAETFAEATKQGALVAA